MGGMYCKAHLKHPHAVGITNFNPKKKSLTDIMTIVHSLRIGF